MLDRDSLGRFTLGHTPLTPRDKTTGQFVKKPMVSEYEKTRVEVDVFLKDLEEVFK